MKYFDHSATTPIHPEVVTLLNTINIENYGNPSSVYNPGLKSRRIIEKSRRQFANAIGASSNQILFTSGGTESNNHIIWNLLFSKNKHVITSSIEHPAILKVLNNLKPLGIEYSILPVDKNGIIKIEKIDELIRSDTGLISIMFANNEVGSIQPIKNIVSKANKYNIPVHSDAVQVLGKIPINVDIGVDFISFSAHKFYGPKGVGALYVKNKNLVNQFMIGGSQETGLRGGTENISGIAGMGLASEIATKNIKKNQSHLKNLELVFREELIKFYPQAIFHVESKNCLPGLISVSLPNIKSNILIAKLDRDDIYVSNGPACSSGNVKPSPVLEAMGISKEYNTSTIRISFGHDNKLEDINFLLNSLKTHLTYFHE